MIKISKKLSLNISMALSIVFFIICIAGAFVMPYLVEMLINIPDNIGIRNEISSFGCVFVHIFSYLLLFDVILADTLLYVLLLRVKHGKVFTPISVSLIRGVSWCCVFLCLVFCCLGIYFQLSFIVAFVALFLGICLRVVKNVIEEATVIKYENDLTV